MLVLCRLRLGFRRLGLCKITSQAKSQKAGLAGPGFGLGRGLSHKYGKISAGTNTLVYVRKSMRPLSGQGLELPGETFKPSLEVFVASVTFADAFDCRLSRSGTHADTGVVLGNVMYVTYLFFNCTVPKKN